MKKLHRPGPGPQRGAAALIVVLLLFFVISLVAAYAGRNLIFEQRTSTNQYRATQAFEAAEAGLEWAVAMLNGGPIGAACAPSANAADKSFRQRFLREDPVDSGQYVPATWDAPGGPERLRPSCIRNGAGWNCSCLDAAAPTPAVPVGGGTNPAFRVCFERVPLDPLVPVQQGTVRIVSTGRTRFADLPFVDQPCEEPGQGTADDAAATVSVVVALSSALATPPSAALTAVGNLNAPAPASITLDIVGALDKAMMISYGGPENALNALPLSLTGTPIEHLIRGNDTSLTGLLPDQMFASLFRMGEATHKYQPAALRLDCAVDCSANTLEKKVLDNPGRIIWVEGAPLIDANVNLGTVVNPALILTSGSVQISAAAQITGMLYSSGNIAITGNPQIQGAIVAAGDVNITGAPTLTYNPAILKPSLFTGSFVRVPGSWRDFP
jgi:hypothetical protein